jgi:hypothetical protein
MDVTMPVDLMLLFGVGTRPPQDGVLKGGRTNLPYSASTFTVAGHRNGSVLA